MKKKLTNRQRNLVLENFGLVNKALSKCRPRNVQGLGDRDDAWQEGLLALADAARFYDPAKGFKFSTYAVVTVQRRLDRVGSRGNGSIRLPQWNGKLSEGTLELRRKAVCAQLKNEHDVPNPEHNFNEEHQENCDRMARAFQRLSRRNRVLARALFVKGVPVRRVARKLKIPKEAGYRLQERLRQKLLAAWSAEKETC